MARSFKEKAHLNTDKKKYNENYDKIFGAKYEKENDLDSDIDNFKSEVFKALKLEKIAVFLVNIFNRFLKILIAIVNGANFLWQIVRVSPLYMILITVLVTMACFGMVMILSK